MAPLPPRIVEKGLASNPVVVETVTAKYLDHMPLYRQAAILEREAGLEIGTNSAADARVRENSWEHGKGSYKPTDISVPRQIAPFWPLCPVFSFTDPRSTVCRRFGASLSLPHAPAG